MKEKNKNKKINKWFFLFLPFGIYLTICYIPNIKPVILYLWFIVTHPSLWFSLRYVFLGPIFEGLLLTTFLTPLTLSVYASQILNATEKNIVSKILKSFRFIVLIILIPFAAGLIAGYIEPNYLQEFSFWYFNK